MSKKPAPQLSPDMEIARERRLVAMHLQEIEDNPLDTADVAMFEMFEREGWSPDKRRSYIAERALAAGFISAAE
ncbi:hypothetical protein DWF00_00315 [Bosea caraganae]|uniref:Uncharacterized protein n=1 Tax=Bosea caraganae TaxID=2763117 RepID=A0A370L8E3_9HYPH|nr:hypothetical protein [Bosea caraganae]RDJ26661.1 hypothetical protein DWE98_07330 [Bosea caraganae]RDJ30548.1 hypothetical protein DWF00_00315 [Bosea caraganae]